ncbi:PREDICTED: C-C motif chemokine 5-like [Cyprinodon variegatus]|uniref:C-C motif chemokine 5-like n=1 Tax=Cyprinodon variegatus TaxID=28743 RepID=UPI0007426DD4|nr:PREDICTED: C-C motif chemokine 5-like [Cyprinodon variegatus]
MKVAHIYLLCILGAALLSTVLCNSGIARAHCCFKFFPRPINKKRISSYYKTDARCHVNAIVLITKQSRRICVNSKRPWVVKIIDYLRS